FVLLDSPAVRSITFVSGPENISGGSPHGDSFVNEPFAPSMIKLSWGMCRFFEENVPTYEILTPPRVTIESSSAGHVSYRLHGGRKGEPSTLTMSSLSANRNRSK